MEIRQCIREELAAISFVEQEAGKRYAEIVNNFSEPFMPFAEFEKAFNNGVTFFGAFDADKLTAFIGYRTVEAVALVRGLFVLPDCQNQGTGSALYELFEQEASSDGMAKIMLLAHKDADWAVGFYKNRGFTSTSDNYDALVEKYWSPLHPALQCCVDENQMLIMQKLITKAR